MLYVYFIILFLAKSLEYFLKDLLVDSSNKATKEGSNKVYSSHIKSSIMSNPNLKFLNDLVSDIPDEKSKKKKSKK